MAPKNDLGVKQSMGHVTAVNSDPFLGTSALTAQLKTQRAEGQDSSTGSGQGHHRSSLRVPCKQQGCDNAPLSERLSPCMSHSPEVQAKPALRGGHGPCVGTMRWLHSPAWG